MRQTEFFLFIAAVLTMAACTKQASTSSDMRSAVETGPYDELFIHSASLYGWCYIVGDDNNELEYGIEYSDTNLDISAIRIKADSRDARNEYVCRIENLHPGTSYYYRAYACFKNEYVFGETKEFELPSVDASLSAYLDTISFHSATISGNLKVNSEGTNSSTAILYYSDSADSVGPLKAVDTYVHLSLDDDGAFITTISGLDAEKIYHFVVVANVDGFEFTSPVFFHVTHSIPIGAVDLGLSVVWASCNLGAKWPEEYGTYYPWGGTEDFVKDGKLFVYDNCPYGAHSYNKWLKYITDPSYGAVDNKTTLEPEDDAARLTLGGKWRMPTEAECRELIEECSWSFTPNFRFTGVDGITVTSKKAGYTDRSIFLPMTGFRMSTELCNDGMVGGFWTSSLHSSKSDCAYFVGYDQGSFELLHTIRQFGRPLRPVSE